MRATRFLREAATAPYYRRRPCAVLQFAYAKWLLSRFRIDDPIAFLHTLAIDTVAAMDGFQKWLPRLQESSLRCGSIKAISGVSRDSQSVSKKVPCEPSDGPSGGSWRSESWL